MKKERGLYWAALYTGLFLIGIGALVLAMFAYRRTLVWSVDGVRQYYPSIGYIGQLLRGLFRGESVPMMKFTLGQGMDVLTSCAYYGYADPLCLLAALFSEDGVEIGYGLISLLRLYLAGLAAGAYMRHIGIRRGWAIACAAAVYVFSGFSRRFVGVHPFFLNGPLFLPLMLIGVERILDGRKWLMLTLITALMLMANFYFAYMNTVIAVVYIVVRLCARIRDRGVSESAKDGFILLGSYILGAMLSAIVFLPVVIVFLSNIRLGQAAGYAGSMLHYGRSYYLRLLAEFFSPAQGAGNGTLLGFSPLAAIGLLALLFTRGARARQVRIALYLCVAGLCVPLVGKIMNGMAYISNRWAFAPAFFVSAGCAIGLAQLPRMKKWQRRAIAGLALLYAAFVVFDGLRSRAWSQLWAAALIVMLSALLFCYDIPKLRSEKRFRLRPLITGVLVVGYVSYLLMGYLPAGQGLLLEEMPMGFYRDMASAAAGRYIDDDGVYRVSQGRYDDAQSLMLDYMGTSSYWSLVEPYTPAYYQNLMLPTQTSTCHIYGLGGSAALNTVASVRYITQQEGESWVIPYGFEETTPVSLPNGKTARVYENAHALPLGYAFDRVISTASYEALPVEDRIRMLTACAICDEAGLPQAESGDGAPASEIEYGVSGLSDVVWEDRRIEARDGGTVELTFDAPEDCETFLIIEGIETDIETDASSERGGILVESEWGRDEGNIMNPRNNFYFQKKGLAFCLGSKPLHGCRLTFERDGNYVYDRVRVVGIPLSRYRDDVSSRRAEALTDVRLSDDRIDGSIAVSGRRILQIAVPYSKGWRARVDGEERPVFLCGGMYMGIALEEGAHTIAMRYETPGLKMGMIISAAALVLTLALWLVTITHRRPRKEGD